MFKQNKNQNSQKLETCYITKNTFKLLWKCIRFFFWNISLCKLTSIQQQVGLQRFLRLFLTDIVVRLPLHSSIVQHCFRGDGCMRDRESMFSLIWNGDKKKNQLDYRKKEEKKLRTLLIKTQKTCQKHNTSQKNIERKQKVPALL